MDPPPADVVPVALVLAADWPLAEFTVQAINVYWVLGAKPLIALLVAALAAVVVESASQLTGATAPDL